MDATSSVAPAWLSPSQTVPTALPPTCTGTCQSTGASPTVGMVRTAVPVIAPRDSPRWVASASRRVRVSGMHHLGDGGTGHVLQQPHASLPSFLHRVGLELH